MPRTGSGSSAGPSNPKVSFVGQGGSPCLNVTFSGVDPKVSFGACGKVTRALAMGGTGLEPVAPSV